MNSKTAQSLETAIAYHLAGNIAVAFELYSDVLSINPDNITALVNQSTIFMDIGRPAEAAYLLEHAVSLAPEDMEALNNYGNALQKLGRYDAAIKQFKRSLALSHNNSAVAGNLGRALLRQGDYLAAINVLETAIRHNPENAALKFVNALALPIIPENSDQLHFARERLSSLLHKLARENLKLTDPINEVGITNFTAAYQGMDDRKIQEDLASAYRAACPELNFSAPHIGQKRKPGRFRIGFISENLCSHTIGKLNRAMIIGLNKNQFEVFVFCPGKDKRWEDEIIVEISEAVEHIYFPAPTLACTRAIIAEAALDILYFTDIGMEPLSYFLGFARLAPVQCVTWGHPVTTGIPTIDYFISSELTEPEKAENFYSEKLVRLEGFTTDFVLPNIPHLRKTRAEFGLQDRTNLYICPQSLFKFHPDFDEILGEILRQDINGEIILLEGQHPKWVHKLRARFMGQISDVAARIKFIPRLSGADYLQLIGLADVILDTPFFCGGNTSYEAFALGKIVVTLPGAFMRGRLTLGLYRQMGIDVPLAETAEDYIKIALKFGLNKEAREEIESYIQGAYKTLFNTRSASRMHEEFFLEAIKIASH